ncbi:MAG: hypothetical protein HQ558_07530 [Candidatus Omnitrophica bacterium]|nr:hypothetical protein [Candidatus Omnitrophota bacterium]
MIAWVFFFVALVATISIRAVNVALDANPMLAKAFWYTGIIGFSAFFIYKFRNDQILHRELQATRLSEKLLSKEKLSEHDYEVLGTIVCRLSSKKDKINYFFIFFFSGVALALAIYADFFRFK